MSINCLDFLNLNAQLHLGLTRTVRLHDLLWSRGPLSSLPRSTQLDTNMVPCGGLQVH